MDKLQKFTDLKAWQEAHKLVLLAYKYAKHFPSTEVFVLTNQMLRSAISVTSNLAEGFGRRSLKEKARFYYQSQASLVELQNQFIIARDVGYVKLSEYEVFENQFVLVHKLITGLIKGLRR